MSALGVIRHYHSQSDCVRLGQCDFSPGFIVPLLVVLPLGHKKMPWFRWWRLLWWTWGALLRPLSWKPHYLLLVVCRRPSAFCPFRECFSYRDPPHSKVTPLSRNSSHPVTFRNHKGLAVLAHLKDNRVLAAEFPVRFCGVLWEPLLPLHPLPHPAPDPLIPFLRYWYPVHSQVNIQTVS